jgi:hypothetical protein
MMTIWKFELEFNDITKISIPEGAEILTVQIDQKTNTPCIWALVDTCNDKEVRFFELFGTGQEIYFDMGVDRVYIGTYQYQMGGFVGHVFERIF